MEDQIFNLIKSKIDKHIASLDGKKVGIKVGFDLFNEFRKRDLLKIKTFDFLLWEIAAESYNDYYIFPSFDIKDCEYEFGTPKN